jgi:hypothetical protein
LVAQKPITVPRSRRWNHGAMDPTLPDHPVACARPLMNRKAAMVCQEFANPNTTLQPMLTAMPTRSISREPHLFPVYPATNCPIV